MISRLEDALSYNRRFSADVSHELRTPLTIMRGELEHILLDPDLSLDTRDSVSSVIDGINRMTKIVKRLLAIAKLDSGANSIHAQPEDLSIVCHWVMELIALHILAIATIPMRRVMGFMVVPFFILLVVFGMSLLVLAPGGNNPAPWSRGANAPNCAVPSL
jgi:signal transduction histidine kinase